MVEGDPAPVSRHRRKHDAPGTDDRDLRRNDDERFGGDGALDRGVLEGVDASRMPC
jgi:hypothetical protein